MASAEVVEAVSFEQSEPPDAFFMSATGKTPASDSWWKSCSVRPVTFSSGYGVPTISTRAYSTLPESSAQGVTGPPFVDEHGNPRTLRPRLGEGESGHQHRFLHLPSNSSQVRAVRTRDDVRPRASDGRQWPIAGAH